MATQISGQPGEVPAADNGAPQAFRQGRTSEAVVTELHGKYYESGRKGRVFSAAMPAAVALTTGAATAAVASVLYVPAAAKVLVVPIRVELALITAPGTATLGAFGIYANVNPVAAAVTGTLVAPITRPLGSSAATPVATHLSTAALPAAPTLFKLLGQRFAALAASAIPGPILAADFDGMDPMGAGSALSVQEITADTTTNWLGIVNWIWEEYPV